MRTINNYISNNIISTFLVTLFVMSSLAWISQTIRYIELIIQKDRTIIDFISLTILLFPWLISIMAPSCMFIATIIVLDRMIRDSETIILHASGLRPHSQWMSLIKISLLITIFIYINNIFITPWCMQEFREKITTIKSDIISSSFKESEFISPDDNFTIFVNEKEKNGVLHGIIINDKSKKDSTVTYTAKRAYISKIEGNLILEMEDGKIFNSNQLEISEPTEILVFDNYSINLSNILSTASTVFFKPTDKSLRQLLFPDNVKNQLEKIDMKNEAHSRLSNPLYTLAFVFVALFYMNKNLNLRSHRYKYIFYASAVAFIIKITGIYITSVIQNIELYYLHYTIPVISLIAFISTSLPDFTLNKAKKS